jgi:hypothetical protein
LGPNAVLDIRNSTLSDNVAGADTGVPDFLLDDGSTITQHIATLAQEAKNHGQFVSAVTHLPNDLVRKDLITRADRAAIHNAAAGSPVPERDPIPR